VNLSLKFRLISVVRNAIWDGIKERHANIPESNVLLTCEENGEEWERKSVSDCSEFGQIHGVFLFGSLPVDNLSGPDARMAMEDRMDWQDVADCVGILTMFWR
jgi:hypothetical protein